MSRRGSVIGRSATSATSQRGRYRRRRIAVAVLGAATGAVATSAPAPIRRMVLSGLGGALGIHLLSQRRRLAQIEADTRWIRQYGLTGLEATVGASWGLSDLDRIGPLPALGGFALSPRAAHALAKLVAEHRPKRVLELGPGASTVIVAMTARAIGHSLEIVSLEHNPHFANAARAMCDRLGVTNATTLTAPLEATTGWYDDDAVASLDPGFDLLVVDGPPNGAQTGARAAALPRLQHLLIPGALILVDDTERADERQMVNEWVGEGRCQLVHDGQRFTVLCLSNGSA